MSIIGDDHNQAEEDRIVEKLLEVVEKSKNIYCYDFRFNQISD